MKLKGWGLLSLSLSLRKPLIYFVLVFLILGTFFSTLIFPPVKKAHAALGDNLVSYWKLDEASGTRADSVSTNNLTDMNTVTQAPGKLGNAASFTASNTEYLSVNDNASLRTGDIDFTISAWVYLTDKTAVRDIVTKYNNYSTNNREYVLQYDTTDRFLFSVSSNGLGGGPSIRADNLGSPSLSTWYFIVAWHDSVNNTLNIQVNNGAINSVAYASGVFAGNSPFIIGAIPAATRYFDGRIDSVGLWKKVLSSQERTDLYNSGNGLEYPFTVSDSIGITTPVSYRVFQRNGSNHANISITGTYTGTPTAIEASWNSGTYTTIDASPVGGTFSGTLSNQTAGQGALTVRFTNDNIILATKTYIGIGDIFVVAGQSNADGYGLNLHSYSNPTLKASMVDSTNTWKELTDPTSQVSGAHGSEWPLLATLFMADQHVPVAFIPTSLSGTRIAQWARNNSDPGDASTLYGQMHTRINNVETVKAVLWWQGESEAADNQTYNYNITNYRILVNNIYSDFSVKTVMAQIGDRSTTNPVTALDNVRLAQRDLWNEGGNALPGPSLYDVTLTVDGVHFKTDAEQQTATNRWWAAIKQDFYGGTDGRGPILSAAEYNLAKTQITLTFTSAVLPLLPVSGFSGITVKDGGVAATTSSITKTAANKLLITLSSAASGAITVSLGQGRTGTGATVPTDSSTYNLPAEIFVDHATTSLDETPPTAPTPVSSVAVPNVSSLVPSPTEIIQTVRYYANTLYVYFSAPSAHAFDSPFTFDASESFSTKGIVAYLWDFGDGTTSDAMKIDHKYQSPGRYIVTLTVTDKDGKTSTKTQTMDVNPPKPTVEDISADGSDLVFKGKSYPKTIVHLEIHSNPISAQTTADDNGLWTYKVANAKEVLGAGDHTVLASASYVLADQTELKSEPSKTYDFKVSLDGDKLKVEMGKTKIWQYVSLGLGLVLLIIIGFVLLRRRR